MSQHIIRYLEQNIASVDKCFNPAILKLGLATLLRVTTSERDWKHL